MSERILLALAALNLLFLASEIALNTFGLIIPALQF